MRDGKVISLLHIFPSFARGGQQIRFAAIAEALGDEFLHQVVSLDGDLSARSALRGENVSFEAFVANKCRTISISNLIRFDRIFRKFKPNMLCTYNFGSLEAVLANNLGPRLPHIHYEDGFGGDETKDSQIRKRIRARRALLKRSFVTVPSRSLATTALHDWLLPPHRLNRISNGIDVEKFFVAGRRRPRGACVTIGAVGALRPEKNFNRLVEAFGSIADGRSRLVIYGEGPELGALRQAGRRHGDCVVLPGGTESPEQAYSEFDVFALSSDTEQMPLTVMEAMASGLPIVATDVGDVKEMVSQSNKEFIVPRDDQAALSAALSRLVKDEDLRARLGAANAAKARSAFRLNDMVSSHKALYLEALEWGRR